MIRVENLSISYKEKEIIKNIDFDIKKGEFVTILGRNGSGKTSIINAVAGNISLQSGDILVDNIKISKESKKKLAKKVAFLLQFNENIEDMKVHDFVAFGRAPHKRLFDPLNKDDFDKIDLALRRTELVGYEDRLMSTLSGGEKQRVYLAMCLVQEPEVLILDEPTNHLDIKYQFELLSLIKRISRENGMTVMCVLHDINQAIKYSDQIIMLDNKRIYKKGSPIECITPETIKKVYEIDSEVHYTAHGMHVDYVVDGILT